MRRVDAYSVLSRHSIRCDYTDLRTRWNCSGSHHEKTYHYSPKTFTFFSTEESECNVTGRVEMETSQLKKYTIYFCSATRPAADPIDPFASVPRRFKARARAHRSACRTCAASPSMRPWLCPPQRPLGTRYGAKFRIPGSTDIGMWDRFRVPEE